MKTTYKKKQFVLFWIPISFRLFLFYLLCFLLESCVCHSATYGPKRNTKRSNNTMEVEEFIKEPHAHVSQSSI